PDLPESTLWSALIGAAGAAFSMAFIKDLTPAQKIVMVLAGTVISVLFTDPIVQFVDMPTNLKNGAAFLVGMFGWAISGSLLTMVRKADLWDLIIEIALSWFKRRGG